MGIGSGTAALRDSSPAHTNMGVPLQVERPRSTERFCTSVSMIPRSLPSILCASLLLSGASMQAQTQDDNGTYTLSVSAQVVTVPVSVRDKQGKLLDNLTKEDFILVEEGRPQTIRYLTIDRNRPLTVGLLIDTSGSQKDYIPKERAAANEFLVKMLTRPDDTSFLVRFDNAITLLQKATSSKDELRTALSHLEDPHDPRMNPPGGSLFYDALELTSERITRHVDGRNAIIVLTDGRDHGSVLTLEQATEAAQVSNTVIYSILYTDEQATWLATRQAGTTMSGKDVLQKLSDATGGHMFQVSAREPLEKIFGEIADEMRMQYVLGYTPAKAGPGYGFRKIDLKGKDKSWKVQTRTGYFYFGTDEDTN